MKNLILPCLLLTLLTGCEISTANLSNIQTCDEANVGELSCNNDQDVILATGQKTIYASVDLNNAPEGTTVLIDWYGLIDEGYALIDSVQVVTDETFENTVISNLTFEEGIIPTTYKVVFSLTTDNGTPIEKTFAVQ